ncbi:hypothetical protein ES708_10637 [subsurface metagenome]
MRSLLVIIAILVVLALSWGCATPIPPVPAGGQPPVSGETPSLAWMEQVTNTWVVAHRHDWDADAQYDGIRVWVELLDKNEQMVKYENVEMPVTIEIHSTESKTLPPQPSRLIYSATAVLHNWYDDAFVTGAIGVRDIAWEQISPPLPSEQQEYGLMYVTVTLPNGKDYSARYDEVRIVKYEATP